MSDRDDANAPPVDKPTVGQLVERLSEQITRLVRAEIALAKAELAGKLRNIGVALALFGLVAVLASLLVGVLIFAAIAGFATGGSWWAAALWVALIIAGVIFAAVVVGVVLLKRSRPLAPEKAAENIKQDVSAIKEGLRP